MRKLIFAFVLAVSMVLTSCDCGFEVKQVELREPEVEVYNLYGIDNRDFSKLYVYKYETTDAYIYRYVMGGETRNFDIIQKNQYTKPLQETESILSKDTYFDY